ncbi:hypothetical protein B4107_0915 [Bacillus safensis]|nr:hypothetical protein B4107_0915 [Bacillus safensis]
MSLLIIFPLSYHKKKQKRKQDKRTPLVAHPAPAEEMLMLSFECLLNSLFIEIKNSRACYFCRKHLI